MKKTSRILSAVLTLMMLFSLVPMNVFAGPQEEPVTYLNISIPAPKVGEKPQDAYIGSSKCSVSTEWKNLNGDVFEPGTEYTAWFYISAEEGYCFDRSSFSLTVNGNPVETGGSIFDFHTHLLYVEYTFPATKTSSDIENVKLWVNGPYPGSNMNDVGSNDPRCIIRDFQWTPMEKNGEFEYGTEYTVRFELEADPSLSTGMFSRNATFSISGHPAKVLQHHGEVVVVECTFPRTQTEAEMFPGLTPIKEVRANFILPSAGDSGQLKVTFPANSQYKAFFSRSLDASNHYLDVSKYEQGHEYYICIDFHPIGSYAVTKNTKIFLNGKEVEHGTPSPIGNPNPYGKGDTYAGVYRYTIPYVDHAGTNITVRPPLARKFPSDAHADDDTCKVIKTTWKPNDKPFDYRTVYEVTVELEVKNKTRKFAEDAKFTINGEPADSVKVNGRRATVTYKFDATARDPNAPEPDYIYDGWYDEFDSWVYISNGKKVTAEWKKINNNWYYFDENSKMAAKGWKKIKNRWYSFQDWGGMRTGWYKDPQGVWYYLEPSGAMAANGWRKIGTKWYAFQDWGGMRIGWYKDNSGRWFYLRSDGSMMAGGWAKIDGKWYYFYEDGAMAVNTTIDGCYVNGSGVWIL